MSAPWFRKSVRLSDDGNTVVMQSEPWLIGKVFAVVFCFLGVSLPLIIVLSLALPPSRGVIECDRERGQCTLGAAAPKQVAIAEIAGAKLVYERSTRNSSSSHYVEIEMKRGSPLRIGQNSYHDEITAGMRDAVNGFNRFLSEPDAKAFSVTFIADDTDWASGIPLSIFAVLGAVMMLKAWTARRVELDRSARRMRLAIVRKLGRSTDETFAFEEIRKLSFAGVRWGSLSAITARGQRVLATVPNTASGRRNAMDLIRKLGETLDIGVDLDDGIRRTWRLEGFLPAMPGPQRSV